jgi:hypothetical protein
MELWNSELLKIIVEYSVFSSVYIISGKIRPRYKFSPPRHIDVFFAQTYSIFNLSYMGLQ